MLFRSPSSTDHARTLYLPDGTVRHAYADDALPADCTRAVKPDTLRARLLPSYHKPRLSRMRKPDPCEDEGWRESLDFEAIPF